MKTIFRSKLFWALTIAFAITAVAGTLLHECGHYIVARALGYDATISYAFTNWEHPKMDSTLQLTYAKYGYQILHHLSYPDQEKVDLLEHKKMQESFWMTITGPLQTIVTGCVGLLLIFIYRKKYALASKLSFWMWLPIFLSLFWARQVFNFIIGAGVQFLKAVPNLKSDETKLSIYFGWPTWLLSAATAFTGLIATSFVVFKVVPKKYRTVFMAAGFLGGLGGFTLWIKWLGPMLLP